MLDALSSTLDWLQTRPYLFTALSAALLDWLLFARGLATPQWLGMLLAGSGVYLSTRR